MSEGIAYQNKDITSKVFAETFGQKSFGVYGISLPKVRRMLPTNLPAIETNELRMDGLFELDDQSVALVDYESVYRERDKVKYAKYMVRVSDRYLKAGKKVPKIRMIVIYTADVKREEVATDYDKEGYRVRIIPAFLSELDSESIRQKLHDKVTRGEPLTDEDMMEFIVLPLTYPTNAKKCEILKEAVHLASKIEERTSAVFVLAGLLTFSDKIIDVETRNAIGGMIHMTQIGRMLWEEKEAEVAAFRAEMEREIAEKDRQLKESRKAIAKSKKEKEKLIAKSERLLAEKEEEKAKLLIEKEEERVKLLIEKEAEKAKLLAEKEELMVAKGKNAELTVKLVNGAAQFHNSSVEEACREVGVSMADYASALLWLSQTTAS